MMRKAIAFPIFVVGGILMTFAVLIGFGVDVGGRKLARIADVLEF